MEFMAGKKTLIVNTLALVAVILSGQFGFDLAWFHTKQAIELLTIVNIVLRLLTKGPVAW